MDKNEILLQEVERESRKLDEAKNIIADSLYFLFKKYVYAIDKTFWFKGVKLKIGNCKVKLRQDWDGDYYIFKVYVNRKKAIHLTHTIGSNYASRTYDTYIKYIDINKLLELQTFHNQLVEIVTEKLLAKKEKFEELNNFNLALKELST